MTNNTNSNTKKKLTTKEPLDIDSLEEEDAANSRKYNKNTDKVSSVNPDYSTNTYDIQGSPNKNANFNGSNDPNIASGKTNHRLNVLETEIVKEKNMRYD